MPVTLQDKLDRLPAKRRAKVERRAAQLIEEEMTLRELRKAHALTQVDLARRLKIKQASVVKLERRSDMLLSTLRRYIVAMGGELEIVAHLPNRAPVRISELGDLEHEPVGERELARVHGAKYG